MAEQNKGKNNENKRKNKNGVKYRAKNENKVTIYKNCIVYRGHQTLFFSVNLYNYNLYTEDSISNQLDIISNLILNIENSFSEVKFSLFRFQDVVSPEKYLEDFIKTVRLWNPDFMPTPEFTNNIRFLTKDYCFLAVNIDEKKSIDFNQTSLWEMVKEYKDNLIDTFANFEQQNIDTAKIEEISTTIENIGQQLLKPCPEEILLSYFLHRIFPSYDLVLDEKDYEQNKVIVAWLKQDYIDHFNYFEMTNSGVEIFGAKQQMTYGSVIDIIEFPEQIISESFPLVHDGLIVNNKTLSKQQAKLKFSRKRADLEYEEETATQANSLDASLELADYKDIVETGLAAVSLGKKIITSDVHILVLANDLETLNKRRAGLISNLKDRDIIATFSPSQANTYLDSFIRLRPKNYPFTFDLRYPLAFRLNQGNAVFDGDSKFTVPKIGHYVDAAEATAS